MKLACIVFTQRGQALATRLLPGLPGWQVEITPGFGAQRADLRHWTQEAFENADALLFIGAAGIAVRAVAPHLQGKTHDPAVVVMDEAGQFAVPLLSGHIGGANRLAKALAALSGGQAVLTTATDVNGLWAVDEWAAQQGLVILNPVQIKEVSARLLRGERVLLHSDVPVAGGLPQGVALAEDRGVAHVVVSPYAREAATAALFLAPRDVVVGIGCRRGTPEADIAAAVAAALQKVGVCRQALCAVASIDLKQDEAGLNAFCEAAGLPLTVYTAGELAGVEGSVSPSGFVRGVTGVDNVCERSALAGGGRLLLPKQAAGGVTVALALRETFYSFEEA